MTLSDYFLSTRGRIGRKEFWLGMLALIAVTLPVSLLMDPDAFTVQKGAVTPPNLSGTIWSLIVTWPSTAIIVKRLNDRNWPHWLGFALSGLMVALVVANYFGLMIDHERMAPWEALGLALAGIAVLWVLIENGFQRGTPGDNRYGPDPLASVDSGRAPRA